MVWYSHLLNNFPQFVVIDTIRGFSTVNEAKVDVFLELPCFLHDPVYVGNLISSSSASLKPSFIGKYLKQIEERFRMIKFLKEHKPIKIRTYLQTTCMYIKLF